VDREVSVADAHAVGFSAEATKFFVGLECENSKNYWTANNGHGMTEPLKIAPRGYPKDHPRVDLLRQKAVSAHRRLSGAPLRDGTAVRQFVVDTFDACGPLNDWIKSNIGSSRTASGRR
jgi:Conserved hypothetical protein (DUF2461)